VTATAIAPPEGVRPLILVTSLWDLPRDGTSAPFPARVVRCEGCPDEAFDDEAAISFADLRDRAGDHGWTFAGWTLGPRCAHGWFGAGRHAAPDPVRVPVDEGASWQQSEAVAVSPLESSGPERTADPDSGAGPPGAAGPGPEASPAHLLRLSPGGGGRLVPVERGRTAEDVSFAAGLAPEDETRLAAFLGAFEDEASETAPGPAEVPAAGPGAGGEVPAFPGRDEAEPALDQADGEVGA
jgi:hypothetical protein